MRIKVKVKPNSRENSIREIDTAYFEIKVAVPPEKGKANKKAIELISEFFDIPKSKIVIISGESYHEKVINIDM